MRIPLTLPELTEEERNQSALLTQEIKYMIEQNGSSIPFSEYFKNALYHPKWGYYTSNRSKFGEEGDFITAPLISPFFSYCLANQIRDVISYLDHAIIVELGAGLGVMASDILTHLKTLNALPEYYYILEVSPSLRKDQYTYLLEKHPDFIDHIIWINEPLAIQWEGVLIANEVLDALPVERFSVKDGHFVYADVAWDDTQGFVNAFGRQDQTLIEFESKLKDADIILPENYLSEFNPQLKDWIQHQTKLMTKGIQIWIDYGYSQKEYYDPARIEGTLIAHYKHRVHNDWNRYCGIQDLTASVDFTAVAEAGASNGFDLLGYTNQAYFLYGSGLEQLLLEAQSEYNQIEWYSLSQSIQQLIMPNEMGERFKVIALSKEMPIEFELSGFSLFELNRLL